jgi:hypothetical protein
MQLRAARKFDIFLIQGFLQRARKPDGASGAGKQPSSRR